MLTPRVRVHGVGTMEKFEEGITGFKRQQWGIIKDLFEEGLLLCLDF
jgi:hypothetical protein